MITRSKQLGGEYGVLDQNNAARQPRSHLSQEEGEAGRLLVAQGFSQPVSKQCSANLTRKVKSVLR